MRSIGTALLVVCVFVAWAQRPAKQSASDVLFSVNNRPVLSNEFIYLYKKNHQNPNEDFTKQKVEEYLTLFINFKLKVEEARSRGLDTTEVFRKEFNGYKEELRKPYLPEGKMLDSLVLLTYNRLKEEVGATHILITVQPDAPPADTLSAFTKTMEIKKKALAGGNFGELAASYSEDPSAKVNKGDLGYFTALQMVYDFENAAYTGKPGDVVGPIRTRFGYHLLKIEGRRPARGEVEVSHIMIRTAAGADDPKPRNLVFEIYDQLKGGVSWDDLCTQYSDDPNSKNSGGRLRPFGVGAVGIPPEFDKVAFSLKQPGEISDPFQTPFGWHIIRLEQKIPLPAFDELAASLKQRVQRDDRVQISKQALLERLKREYAFSENNSVKSKIFSQADSSLIKGNWKIMTGSASDVLFKLKTRSVSVKEFVQYVNKSQHPSTLSPEAVMAQYYNSFVESVMNQAYEDELMRTNPDYEMLLREYYEGILLFDVMEKEVWNKASDDTVGQKSFFNQFASNYVAGERIQAEIYSANNQENITAITQAIQKNDSLAIQELVKARKARVEKGAFQKSDRPILSKVSWMIGDYSAENSGMYYLVRILEILAPGPLTLDEAKASVISDYQNYLEKNWVEQLKKKYSVKINEKSKQSVFKQLIRS